MKEEQIINLITQIVPSSRKFIGDDTAFIQNRDLILTQDTLVEDVHFRLKTISAYDLGYKSVAVNLSDIAASGGIAEFVLVSVALPSDAGDFFIRDLYTGINDICQKYGVEVVGGDTCGSDKVVITVSAIGKAQGVLPSKRSNADVGDVVVVTGNHGSSGAGLKLLENYCNIDTYYSSISEQIINKFIKSHTMPEPQLETGRAIAELADKPLAMMDTSDGLADALYKIAKSSKVSLSVDLELIPYDKDIDLIPDIDTKDLIFYGGEDYQLVATLSESVYNNLKKRGLVITKVGHVTKSDNEPCVVVNDDDNSFIINSDALHSHCFDHFSGKKKEDK